MDELNSKKDNAMAAYNMVYFITSNPAVGGDHWVLCIKSINRCILSQAQTVYISLINIKPILR